jgi:hypothetical protein
LQEAVDTTAAVPSQTAQHVTRQVEFQQAETVMRPTAVDGPVKVEGNVPLTSVPAHDLARTAAERCVLTTSLSMLRSFAL